MASLSLALLPRTLFTCTIAGPFRSWPTEVARLSGLLGTKETEARERARLVSIREWLEKEGWRLAE